MSKRKKHQEHALEHADELDDLWSHEEELDYFDDDDDRLSRLKKSGKRFHRRPTQKDAFADDFNGYSED